MCNKCEYLCEGQYKQNELEKYSSKDLKNFLSKKSISTKDCLEKNDLILLIYSNFSRDYKSNKKPRTKSNEKEPCQNFVKSLTEEKLKTENKNVETSKHLSEGNESLERTEILDIRTPSSSSASSSKPTPPSYECLDLLDEIQPETKSSNLTILTPTPIEVSNDIIKLDDIKEFEKIEELTIKQMKIILTNNFVLYKGCCEKAELVSMVTHLWLEHNTNKKSFAENSENSNNSDACKICMDKPIDCVLLECGHMVVCKLCGKQLAECPVCRKYVSRVVHVFKA